MKLKSHKLTALLGICLILTFTACQKESLNRESLPLVSADAEVSLNTDYRVCGNTVELQFIAGQHIEAGSILISNDDSSVHVSFITTGGWKLKETHLYVGDCDQIPTNQKGNPKIGNFPYQTEHDTLSLEDTVTHEILISDIEGGDGCFCIAAHAAVFLVDSNGVIVDEQTAWSEGKQFNEKGSWAMYNRYCLQECEEGPEEPEEPQDVPN